MRRLLALMALAATAAALALKSSPELGVAEGRCRPNEPGPALLVTAAGLKDRTGTLRLEVYPPTDPEFLSDDNVLVAAGKTFRRTVASPPAAGPAELCVRLPAPGSYGVTVIHKRASEASFQISRDGVAFANDPPLRFSQPKAKAATVVAGPGITRVTVRMMYRRSLFSFGPIDQ